MNTEQAINYVESGRYVIEHSGDNKLADEVIELLKEGEKYKKMWGEVEEDSCEFELIKNVKQKYFPKPKSMVERYFERVVLRAVEEFKEKLEKEAKKEVIK